MTTQPGTGNSSGASMRNQGKRGYDNAFMAVVTGISDMFRTKEVCGILSETDRLDGKVVFIDGASSGLGFAIAVDVAKRGARVVMACRSGIPGQGEKVKKLSGNPDVHMLHVDLDDLFSIRQLISGVSRLERKPDIYILNAGIVPKRSRKTRQGLEEMFMVNFFAKFAFIRMLLWDPLIPHPSRIVLVTSESHRNPGGFEWDRFGIYSDYGIGRSMELYGYYKLLLVTFARELSRRINQPGQCNTSVFAMCPGPVNSNIAREAPRLFHPLLKIVFTIFFRSPAEAAKPAVYLAASHDQEGKPFDYLFLMSRREIDPKAADPDNGKKLWELSEQLFLNIIRGSQ